MTPNQNRLEVKVAVFTVLERNSKIFMLRRANTGWADGMWTLPSGHVDLGQTAIEGAIVEINEEALVDVDPQDMEFIHVHYVRDTYINFYFRTTVWKGEPQNGEPHFCSEVGWFAYDKMPPDTITHVSEMLQGVRRGIFFSDIENDPNPKPKHRTS